MVDFLIRLSWLFFNVDIPVFAPVALLPLLGFSRVYRPLSKGIGMRSVQNGQFLWVAISMCASACYEIGSALGAATSDGTRALMLTGLLWHGGLIVTSSILVSFGAADATHDPVNRCDEAPDRRLMWLSNIMTALTAASYSTSNYSFT